MEKLIHKMVNSCKITTELIDKQQLTPLSLKEKLQLQAHKAMCKTCNAYEKQSSFIDAMMQKWFGNNNQTSAEKLATDKKNEIIDSIKEK